VSLLGVAHDTWGTGAASRLTGDGRPSYVTWRAGGRGSSR
jgi:hypothetical protein